MERGQDMVPVFLGFTYEEIVKMKFVFACSTRISQIWLMYSDGWNWGKLLNLK